MLFRKESSGTFAPIPVITIVLYFGKKRVYPNYVPDDLTEIKHVDEVLKLLSVISGDDNKLKK